MTERPATQLEALRAALIACGFLLDGQRYEDRVGLVGYGPDIYLVVDHPEEVVEPPCVLHVLMTGVRPVIDTVDQATAQRALHKLARDLHRSGFWPPDTPPPPEDERNMIVADDVLQRTTEEG
jgi:hypothetical protein